MYNTNIPNRSKNNQVVQAMNLLPKLKVNYLILQFRTITNTRYK